MAETLDAALESLRREQFFSEMASAEASLQANPQDWQPYAAERERWLNADLG